MDFLNRYYDQVHICALIAAVRLEVVIECFIEDG